MTTQSDIRLDNLQAEYDTLAENAVVLADEVRALHDEAVRLRRELVLADDRNRNLVKRQADANAALERQVRRAMLAEDRLRTTRFRLAREAKVVDAFYAECGDLFDEANCSCDGDPPHTCLFHRLDQIEQRIDQEQEYPR